MAQGDIGLDVLGVLARSNLTSLSYQPRPNSPGLEIHIHLALPLGCPLATSNSTAEIAAFTHSLLFPPSLREHSPRCLNQKPIVLGFLPPRFSSHHALSFVPLKLSSTPSPSLHSFYHHPSVIRPLCCAAATPSCLLIFILVPSNWFPHS